MHSVAMTSTSTMDSSQLLVKKILEDDEKVIESKRSQQQDVGLINGSISDKIR